MEVTFAFKGAQGGIAKKTKAADARPLRRVVRLEPTIQDPNALVLALAYL